MTTVWEFRKIGVVILLFSEMEIAVQICKDILGFELNNKSTDWNKFFNRETVLALRQEVKEERELRCSSSSSSSHICTLKCLGEFHGQRSIDYELIRLKKMNMKFFK
jgi:hypothetical protein